MFARFTHITIELFDFTFFSSGTNVKLLFVLLDHLQLVRRFFRYFGSSWCFQWSFLQSLRCLCPILRKLTEYLKSGNSDAFVCEVSHFNLESVSNFLDRSSTSQWFQLAFTIPNASNDLTVCLKKSKTLWKIRMSNH